MNEELLIALLEGLEVPDPYFWLRQSPETIKELGTMIALKAKGFTTKEVNFAERIINKGVLP